MEHSLLFMVAIVVLAVLCTAAILGASVCVSEYVILKIRNPEHQAFIIVAATMAITFVIVAVSITTILLLKG